MIFKITTANNSTTNNLSSDLFFTAPTWENEDLAAENIAKICRERAGEIYGTMHSVADRLDFELSMMEKTETAFYFLVLKEISDFSKEKGYPTLASGSLAGSLISFLLGITNTNPLPAHYRCDSDCYRCLQKGDGCRYGIDMPDNYCATCGKLMIKDGFDLSAITAWSSFANPQAPDFSLRIAPSIRPLLQKRLEEKLGYADSDLTMYRHIELSDSTVCEDIGKLAAITGKTPVNQQYSNETYILILKELASENEDLSDELESITACDFNTLVKIYGYVIGSFKGVKTLKNLDEPDFFVLRDDLTERLAYYGIPIDLANKIAKTGIYSGEKNLLNNKIIEIMDNYNVPVSIKEYFDKVGGLWSISSCISRLQLMCTLAWYKIKFPNEFASL